jgi:hypothetical protein
VASGAARGVERLDVGMTFRLVYQGPLPSSRSATPRDKQSIRRFLHPQLRELWTQPPLRELAQLGALTEGSVTMPSLLVPRGKFRFVPLVTARLKLMCHLDILFLRPGTPGSVITQGGDVDNRVKTLFDALQLPDLNQVTDDGPAEAETPHFFCLLEDDALVTRVNVETDRLLTPDVDTVGQSRTVLIIGVTLKATELTWANMELVG